MCVAVGELLPTLAYVIKVIQQRFLVRLLKRIQRDLRVHNTVVFFRRQFARTNIDLNRGQDKHQHLQGGDLIFDF